MIYSLLILLCLLAFVVGLFKPMWVLPGGLKPSRAKAAAIYGVLLIVVGMIANNDPEWRADADLRAKEREAQNEKTQAERAAADASRKAQDDAKRAADDEKRRVEAKERLAAEKVALEQKKKSAVSAPNLMATYEENEVAADAAFKGKRFVVKGTIDSIGKDILNTPYVALKGTGIIGSVQFMFGQDDEAALARLSRGQQIYLVGKCDGKLGNVIFRESAILE